MKKTGPIPGGFSALDGALAIGEVKLTDVAAQAGETPLFVYSRALLTETFARLRAAMPQQLAIHYAMKANPFGPLLQHMNGLVDGFDIASGGELVLAMNAGVAPAASALPDQASATPNWKLPSAMASRSIANPRVRPNARSPLPRALENR